MVVEKRQVERTHLLGQSRLDIGPDGGRYLTCQPSRGIGALVIVQRSSPASTTSRRRRPPPAACSQVTLFNCGPHPEHSRRRWAKQPEEGGILPGGMDDGVDSGGF